MYRAFAIALLLTATAQVGRAQITVTREAIEAHLARTGQVTSSETTTPVGVDALAARTGPGQTWDLTGLTFGTPRTTSVAPAGPNPPGSGDPVLKMATHVVAASAGPDSTAYVYHRVTPTGLELMGLTVSYEDEVFGPALALMRYYPGALQYTLPLTAGTAPWASQSDVLLTLDVPEFPPLSSRDTRTSEVEGWGTLVTPAGSAPAVRVRTVTRTESEVATPDGPVVFRDSSVTVEFVTGGTLAANLYLDGEGRPISADHSVFTAASPVEGGPAAGLRLDVAGPNPARLGSRVEVSYELDIASDVHLEVFDVLGRRLGVLADGVRPAGEGRATWATTGFQPGLYLVRLRVGGARTAVRRITLVN